MSSNEKVQHSLTNQEILNSADALAALDKADEKGKPSYFFPSLTRLTLAKHRRQVNVLAEDIIKARTALLNQYDITGGRNADGTPKDDPEKIKAYNAEARALFDAKQSFEMSLIPYSSLTAGDRNEIPVGVITTLLWLIKED